MSSSKCRQGAGPFQPEALPTCESCLLVNQSLDLAPTTLSDDDDADDADDDDDGGFAAISGCQLLFASPGWCTSCEFSTID